MSAENWFRCDIDPKLLKSLMRRSDRQPLIHLGAHYALLGTLGLACLPLWGSWWFLLPYVAYSIVWGYANAISHEAVHGTPFRTAWLNRALLLISGWMVQVEPTSTQWNHSSHHSFTSFPEKDSEFLLGNPVTWRELFFHLSGLGYTHIYWMEVLSLAAGRPAARVRAAVPESDWPRMYLVARLFLLSYAAIIAWSFAVASWLPFVMLLLPRVAGAPVYGLMRVTQHTGLAMNIADHRQSTRSFYAGPLLRFLYLNMNFHVEHHMFPTVPFYNLPKLHAAVRQQMPRPNPGLLAATVEIFRAVWRQHRDPGYVIKKLRPDGSPLGSKEPVKQPLQSVA